MPTEVNQPSHVLRCSRFPHHGQPKLVSPGSPNALTSVMAAASQQLYAPERSQNRYGSTMQQPSNTPGGFSVAPHGPSFMTQRSPEWLGAWTAEIEKVFPMYQHAPGSQLEALLSEELALAISKSEEEWVPALHRTARHAKRLGIPLAELLTALSGPSVSSPDPREQQMLMKLRSARSRAYPRAYLRDGATACKRLDKPHHRIPLDSQMGIVGTNSRVHRLREDMVNAARGLQHILILGEAGSGRSTVAKGIHIKSESTGRFVVAHCATLSGESGARILFGNPEPDAHPSGLFHEATDGTLFFDELARLAPELQARVAHHLEQQKAAGAPPMRILASTCQLEEGAGTIRDELEFYLGGRTIEVPPLRNRASDIPELIEHFLGSYCQRRCGCISGVSEPATRLLQAHSWPGNVQELRQVVEHAVLHGKNDLIQIVDLPSYLHPLTPHRREATQRHPEQARLPTLAEAEARLIRETLLRFGGNKVRAARSLGISRHKLYDRLHKLGLVTTDLDTRH